MQEFAPNSILSTPPPIESGRKESSPTSQPNSTRDLAINPLYNDSSSSSSDDEGIIVVSSPYPSRQVITISSDEEEQSDAAPPLQLSAREQFFAQKSKSVRRKQDFYVAEYGSDFDQNFLTDESDDSESSEDSVQVLEDADSISLNIGDVQKSPPTPFSNSRSVFYELESSRCFFLAKDPESYAHGSNFGSGSLSKEPNLLGKIISL